MDDDYEDERPWDGDAVDVEVKNELIPILRLLNNSIFLLVLINTKIFGTKQF